MHSFLEQNISNSQTIAIRNLKLTYYPSGTVIGFDHRGNRFKIISKSVEKTIPVMVISLTRINE